MRIKKICLIIILICCSMLFFAGCSEERLVKSISLNGYSSEQPLEFGMGKFSYSGYTVTIVYEDGESEERALTEDMIPETDKLKFYQEGKNSITLTYKGAETPIEINVFRNEFSENIQLKDLTTTYNGEVFTVEVEGDIPGGTKIIYPRGNTFQAAGSYEVTAILQCDGYETKTLSAHVEIEKAVYDMSKMEFTDKTVTYNGGKHALGISEEDELPSSVGVTYQIKQLTDEVGNSVEDKYKPGNTATDAGVYEVRAQFKGDSKNYQGIEDFVAYLTIKRAAYDMSKIVFVDKTVTYSGETHTLSVLEGGKLPLDVAVAYQIKQLADGDGNTVEDTYKPGNTATDAGVYLVMATFTITGKNAKNYTTDPVSQEGRLTIRRASYDEAMKDLYLDTWWEEFIKDKTYEIYFECDLPEGVTPRLVLTNESGDSIEVEMRVVVDEKTGKTEYKYLFTVESAGKYSCVVTFEHSNANYDEITVVLNATFYISNVTSS